MTFALTLKYPIADKSPQPARRYDVAFVEELASRPARQKEVGRAGCALQLSAQCDQEPQLLALLMLCTSRSWLFRRSFKSHPHRL
jgi:hypothetical protein